MNENKKASLAELRELHQFFQGWGEGALADTDETFRRLSSVLADDFELVTPEGRVIAKDPLLEGLRSSHGARRGRGYRIRIENERARSIGEGLHLVVYEEWQELEGEARGRLSTAVLRSRAGTPNGVEWLHVHETWLPEEAPRSDLERISGEISPDGDEAVSRQISSEISERVHRRAGYQCEFRGPRQEAVHRARSRAQWSRRARPRVEVFRRNLAAPRDPRPREK